MIGITFNHNMFDDPYKQTSTNLGFKRLDEICNRLGKHLFTSINGDKRHWYGHDTQNDVTDEYVTVQYTGKLLQSDKQEIADAIKEILTLKKTCYKDDELPEILITFSKLADGDIFYYNV